jgi:K+-transporting ATPase ATPase B chain
MTIVSATESPQTPAPRSRTRRAKSFMDREILLPALVDSFKKLDPRWQARNPVMFVVLIGAVMTTYAFATGLGNHNEDVGFVFQIALWLWFTVLFANFAEAVAEGRGKAQAATLRKTRSDTIARKLVDGREIAIPAQELRKGDVVVCEAGDVIPSDGTITDGIASVDESAITGESAPVIREAGGDRSAVTGGTRVLSDRIVIEITQDPGQTFLDRIIRMVESASRQKTPSTSSSPG